MTAPRAVTIALAGNPNAGKTTIFNNLTGASRHVGNYPGKTVEIMEGRVVHRDAAVTCIDLPGTYSLTASSEEERVARQFILDRRADVVVNVLDASAIERHLYLTIQLLEMDAPLVLVLNMSDTAEAAGIRINTARLSALLKTPVVRTVGSRNEGTTAILDAVLEVAGRPRPAAAAGLDYGPEVGAEIDRLRAALRETPTGEDPGRLTWQALKLLENDAETAAAPAVAAAVARGQDRLRRHFGEGPEIIIAEKRYGIIAGICAESVTVPEAPRRDRSDRIDHILVHRHLGLPIFLGLMYLVFHFTFTVGAWPLAWLEAGFAWLTAAIGGLWPAGAAVLLRSLVTDGIIGGVGGVFVFLPSIVLLFMAIAVLEDSGYMARAAFIMDGVMHRLGLHGKSFIPMLIGFGCTVPGIMATRMIENRRDRLATLLVLPLFSCGARLPIYALFIPAFFAPAWRGPVLWIIYLIGIALAVGGARLLKSTLLRGEAPAFVMELPPYRMPTLRGILFHTWERAREYMKKAGTVILGFAIVLWAATTFPVKTSFDRDYAAEAVAAAASARARLAGVNRLLDLPADSPALAPVLDPALGFIAPVQDTATEARDRLTAALAILDRPDAPQSTDTAAHQAARLYREDVLAPLEARLAGLAADRHMERIAYTATGRTGRFLEPILKPLGFDWPIATALIGALAAKEVFVTQLGIVFAMSDNGAAEPAALRVHLQAHYSPLQAFAIMLFCLITTPCVATIAVTRKESGGWRWAFFQVAALTALAYAVTFLVYRGGILLGAGV
ncbi:MAG: ferrous iron transport protein B [Planctomycetota bacterium]